MRLRLCFRLAFSFTMAVAFATALATAFGVPATIATGIGFLLALGVGWCLAKSLGQRQLLYLLAQEVLYRLESIDVVFANKGDSLSIAIGTGCTTDAVYIVLGVARYIVVDDHADIIDVDTTCHNIGGYEYIGLTSLETIHGFVALGLREVGVHLVAVDVHRLELTCNFLYAFLLAREDDDTLQVALLEDILDDLEFLWLVAHVGHLVYLLGRLGYCYLYLYGIVEQLYGQFANLLRHGGREHDALTTLRQLLHNLHDIVDETHVEHTVGLVEYKERTAR